MQDVIRFALQFVADKANTGFTDLGFEDIGNCRNTCLDKSILVEGSRPRDDGDVNAALMHFDERTGLGRVTLAVDAQNCQGFAHERSAVG